MSTSAWRMTPWVLTQTSNFVLIHDQYISTCHATHLVAVLIRPIAHRKQSITLPGKRRRLQFHRLCPSTRHITLTFAQAFKHHRDKGEDGTSCIPQHAWNRRQCQSNNRLLVMPFTSQTHERNRPALTAPHANIPLNQYWQNPYFFIRSLQHLDPRI